MCRSVLLGRSEQGCREIALGTKAQSVEIKFYHYEIVMQIISGSL